MRSTASWGKCSGTFPSCLRSCSLNLASFSRRAFKDLSDDETNTLFEYINNVSKREVDARKFSITGGLSGLVEDDLKDLVVLSPKGQSTGLRSYWVLELLRNPLRTPPPRWRLLLQLRRTRHRLSRRGFSLTVATFLNLNAKTHSAPLHAFPFPFLNLNAKTHSAPLNAFPFPLSSPLLPPTFPRLLLLPRKPISILAPGRQCRLWAIQLPVHLILAPPPPTHLGQQVHKAQSVLKGKVTPSFPGPTAWIQQRVGAPLLSRPVVSQAFLRDWLGRVVLRASSATSWVEEAPPNAHS
ncbi:hypothetical protein B0H14DRAFT_413114 [Mycena olivaceomarginata]|nr:hypothetical protein B0H14DRAFT_413114 [Mycena olivaceomarginata]